MPIGMRLHPSEFGGAKVFRAFRMGDHQYKHGDLIEESAISQIPRTNLNALIDQRYIEPMRKPVETSATVKLQAELEEKNTLIERLQEQLKQYYSEERLEKYLIRRPDLKYDVIRGSKVNNEPLSKIEAEVLDIE